MSFGQKSLATVRHLALGVLGGASLLLACEGSGPGGAPGGASGGAGGEGTATTEMRVLRPVVRRLTHAEWERTVQDLLVLDAPVGLSSTFPADPATAGYLFGGQADVLSVDQSTWAAYQRAAATLAERVVSDEDALERLSPSVETDLSVRAEIFVRSWLPRAFRRPLEWSELDTYARLFEKGAVSFPDSPGFVGGVRLVLEAALQSPYFLYESILSTPAAGEAKVALSGYERATRLSYFLWGTMPDAALFQAALDGELDTKAGMESAARRMLNDERARPLVEYFFERVLDAERFERIQPNTSVFPDAPTTLPELALEELRHFSWNLVFASGGGVRELLTSKQTYANGELAAIYGASGPTGAEFELVTLDETRAGFLTQVGFLASHATSVDPDPIHRGVFIAKRLNCMDIDAPPGGVPPLPSPEGRSNRQTVEDHTEVPGTVCSNCHKPIINPFGFPFENYDAVGAYRTKDGEHDVDPKTTPWIDGETTSVKNALELIEKLAESRDVHRCLAGRVLEFGQGRPISTEDLKLAEALGQASLEDEASFYDLFVEVALTDSFLFRSVPVEGDKQ